MKKTALIAALSFCIISCSDKQSSDDPFVNEIIEKSAQHGTHFKNEDEISCHEEHSIKLSDNEKNDVLSVFDEIYPLVKHPETEEKKQAIAQLVIAKPKLLKSFSKFIEEVAKPCK